MARILIAALSVVTLLAAPAVALSESGLQVIGESSVDKLFGARDDVNQIKECRGSVPAGVELGRAGITPQTLRRGVSCVVGDLDRGAGRYFVLYEPKKEAKRRFLVLFFHRGLLERTQLIAGPSYLVVFGPENPERKAYGQYRRRAPALISFAEGDRGWVFFLNPKTRTFEEVPYEYPPGYD